MTKVGGEYINPLSGRVGVLTIGVSDPSFHVNLADTVDRDDSVGINACYSLNQGILYIPVQSVPFE